MYLFNLGAIIELYLYKKAIDAAFFCVYIRVKADCVKDQYKYSLFGIYFHMCMYICAVNIDTIF